MTKKGGIRKLNAINDYFNEVIANLELVDVRKTNDIYTWNNKRIGDIGISCLLDHFLVSESIMMARRELNVMLLPSSGSNHWPLSFEWERIGVNLRRPFRFETFWLL